MCNIYDPKLILVVELMIVLGHICCILIFYWLNYPAKVLTQTNQKSFDNIGFWMMAKSYLCMYVYVCVCVCVCICMHLSRVKIDEFFGNASSENKEDLELYVFWSTSLSTCIVNGNHSVPILPPYEI
jgi:hypothetical protein